MAFIESISYILIGIIAGFTGGLLGIGGGLAAVPLLYLLLTWSHPTEPLLMQTVIGTSLAAMILTSASSTWAHTQLKGVNWKIFRQLAAAVVLGSLAGGYTAETLSSKTLQQFFGYCTCDDKRNGDSARKSSSAAVVTKAHVFDSGRVVCVSGSGFVTYCVVV